MDLQNRNVQKILIDAVRSGMEVVRATQGGHLPHDPEIKDDKTLVTVIDRRVEEKLVEVVNQNFPNARIIGEEGTAAGDGEIGLLIDPLDGTRAFTSGLATSTIILGVYDFKQCEVVACVVGEAATGRVWFAFGNSRTSMNGFGETRVWQKFLDEQSTVFLDVSHGFMRGDRQILSDSQVAGLFTTLNSRVKLAIPGSNGLIQALVANGGQKVAGSITTAIGGPWDVCGVKLVLNAGGKARAFSVRRRGSIIEDHFILDEKNPLNVTSYDILVCGNSQKTVDFLTNRLPIPEA